MPWHQATKATFRPIDKSIAQSLVDFAYQRNIGKEIELAGHTYRLIRISRYTQRYYKSSISIYYERGHSIVRISDHWSSSKFTERSRKMNCGLINQSIWGIKNRQSDLFDRTIINGGKYPYRLLAGICAIRSFEPMEPC